MLLRVARPISFDSARGDSTLMEGASDKSFVASKFVVDCGQCNFICVYKGPILLKLSNAVLFSTATALSGVLVLLILILILLLLSMSLSITL